MYKKLKIQKESKLKINSALLIGVEINKKKVGQYDSNNNLLKEFNSISEAAKETNTSRCNISKVALGKRLTANDFYWTYEEPITIIEDDKHPVKKRRIPNPSILIESKRRKIN